MKIDYKTEKEWVESVWKKTKFIEVDELGFYHFAIPVSEKKVIDFAIEPSLAVIYKTLIREMEKMHLSKKRESYVETDDFKTPFTSISDSIKEIEKPNASGLRIKETKL